MQSDYGDKKHGNFEVLVEECKQSLVSYGHYNKDPSYPWLRNAVLMGEPPAERIPYTHKVVQLTGEFDRQGWDGVGRPNTAFNRTEKNFNIRGTDLGVSFMHKNRVYFLFGDTWKVGQTAAAPDKDLDSIAFCTDGEAMNGLTLTFNPHPPLVCPAISQHGFEVPIDGFSIKDTMYVFFTTGAMPDEQLPAGEEESKWIKKSLLARSHDDGLNFDQLFDFSTSKFINVSVERGTVSPQTTKPVGRQPQEEVLFIWGTGRYRSSDLYLSILPLKGLDNKHGIRYFANDKWSEHEQDATPLFCAGNLGEISVRWNPFLQRYLALFNSDNPRGINLRSAPQPWGPWSATPVMVFDPGFQQVKGDECSGDGYGRFMHVSWKTRVCDHVQDDILPPGTIRDDDDGGEYGPYQITHYARGVKGQWTQIYFTMSTWNPYQVMLMTTIITQTMV